MVSRCGSQTALPIPRVLLTTNGTALNSRHPVLDVHLSGDLPGQLPVFYSSSLPPPIAAHTHDKGGRVGAWRRGGRGVVKERHERSDGEKRRMEIIRQQGVSHMMIFRWSYPREPLCYWTE
ncbi:hypothetical protein LSTR_LSTR010901 [Laodelphax striatellus]|uniref:Uncharacterized protein n=1 Tax=Laodelphax striatellus TaxID=195883 RepID=A0A482XJ10_LAOST|nr:hypothetical protein LSTR_LSTR010901 [Laodelphax striatellus]